MMTKTFLLVASLAVAGFGCDSKKPSEPDKAAAASEPAKEKAAPAKEKTAPAKEKAPPATVDIHITDDGPDRHGASVSVEANLEVK